MFQRNENSTEDILSKLIWIESEMIRKQPIKNVQENSVLVNDYGNNDQYEKFNNVDLHFVDQNSAESGPIQYIDKQSSKVYWADTVKNTNKNDDKSFPSTNNGGGRQDPEQNELRPSYRSHSMQNMDYTNEEEPSNAYGNDPRQLPPQNQTQPSLNTYGSSSRQDPGWNNDRRQSNVNQDRIASNFSGSVSRQNTAWNGQPIVHNSGARDIPSGSIERPTPPMQESTIHQGLISNNDKYSGNSARQAPIVNEQSNIYGNGTWQNQSQNYERPSRSFNAYRNDIRQDPGMNVQQSSSNYYGSGISQDPDQNSKGQPWDMNKTDFNRQRNPEESVNSHIYNRDIQRKPGAKSRCSNDMSMLIKYIKRLIYAFNELKDDIPRKSEYQDVLHDLIKDAKRFVQKLEKSNRSSVDTVNILKKYDYYRKTYYCLRDKIYADSLMARRDYNSCDNDCSDEECCL